MSANMPTRHWSEDGPTEGYVYLAIRNKTDFSVKIGSTRTTPAQRLAQTPSCTWGAFLIACATTAARELEYHLQLHYTEAGKSLGDREHFSLTIYDVLRLALWFNGSVFTTQDGAESHAMILVDQHGRPAATLEETATLLGDAALTAAHADEVRARREQEAQRRRRKHLIEDWAERTARRWHIKLATFNGLLITGKIEEQLQRAHEYIDQGRLPPTTRMPAQLKAYLEKPPAPWASLDEVPGWLKETSDEPSPSSLS